VSDAAVEIDEDLWRRAVALIAGARAAALVCHVAPDGDALGSMLALARALRGRGIDVSCSWGDERWQRPASWAWLPDVDATVPPGEMPDAPDLLIVLDTGARDRLGVLGGLADSAGAVLVVDHHAHGSDLGDAVRCVDPSAAATAAVVEELLRRLDVPLDQATATCLYAGLVTDTGSFAHSVTTPAVHRLAARLLAAGARPDEVARRVWGTRPLAVVGLLAAALARVRYDAAAAGGRGAVWTWAGRDDIAGQGLALEDVDAVMEAIRVTAEADVAVVAKQDVDGAWKVSSRSRGATDVGAGCAALGGGGHRLAAGFTAPPELSAAGPGAVVGRFLATLG
jgi:phosphoesterase RecJ-like protein